MTSPTHLHVPSRNGPEVVSATTPANRDWRRRLPSPTEPQHQVVVQARAQTPSGGKPETATLNPLRRVQEVCPPLGLVDRMLQRHGTLDRGRDMSARKQRYRARWAVQ